MMIALLLCDDRGHMTHILGSCSYNFNFQSVWVEDFVELEVLGGTSNFHLRGRETSNDHDVGDNTLGDFRPLISAGVIGWSYLFHEQSTSPVEHASQGGANLQFHVSLVSLGF